jgi:hypothetical protein
MCDYLATSREHVPPKCIFPELKDDPSGLDLRKDLITVPSCDHHNSSKSKDDEFLMVSLAGIIGNNSVGLRHKFTKVNRAIARTANRLLDNVFLKRKHFVVEFENNKFIEMIWGTPNYERLQKCFEHIARGLYFHRFGSRFHGRIKMVMGHLQQLDKHAATWTEFMRQRAEIDLEGRERFGSNPGVFYFQFTEPDEFGLIMVKLCFYEGIDIFTVFQPEGVTIHPNLAMMLINGGIKTYVKLEDKTYEFN